MKAMTTKRKFNKDIKTLFQHKRNSISHRAHLTAETQYVDGRTEPKNIDS